MSDPEALVTIADIDNANGGTIVPQDVPAGGSPPAAENAQAAPVAAPTEAQDGAEPVVADQAKPSEGEEPEWFKKRLKDISRQRTNAERRADRLAAELEGLKRVVQPAPPKAADLRSTDFPNFEAVIRAQTTEVARETVRSEIETATRARTEQAEMQAGQRAKETFLEKAQAQAEEANIDLDAVMETLSVQPVLSQTVVEHLAASENSARLAEFLALNPSKLHDVSLMGSALAKRELARLDATLGAKSKPNATNAPPPPPRVGGRTVTQQDWRTSNDMDDYASNWKKHHNASKAE
jgi:hypothetical protein